jgi:hypothetical protein
VVPERFKSISVDAEAKVTLLGIHQLRVHGIRSTCSLTHRFLCRILTLDQIFT